MKSSTHIAEQIGTPIDALIAWIGLETPEAFPEWQERWALECFASPNEFAPGPLAGGLRRRADAIVLDLPIPGREPKELLQDLGTRAPSVPVIVHDPFATVADVVHYIKSGAADVIGPGSNWTKVVASNLRPKAGAIPRKMPPAAPAGASFVPKPARALAMEAAAG